MANPDDVWQDVQWTSEGLSVTTYTHTTHESPTVADESYWTWAELLVKACKHAPAVFERVVSSETTVDAEEDAN